MPIDPSIALSVKPIQLEDQVSQLAKIQQLKAMQQENAFNNFKMNSAMREQETQNKIRNAFANASDQYSPEFQRELLGIDPDTGLKFQKSIIDKQTAESGLKSSQLKLAADKTAMYRDALSNINNPEQAAAWMQAQYSDPDLGGIMQRIKPYDVAVSSIPNTPEQFQQWKQQAALGMTKFMELNKPQITTQDLGGRSQIVATPGLGGDPRVLGSFNKSMSPGEIASNARGWADIATKREANQVAREGNQTKRVQDLEMKMADDYRADSKGFGETSTSMKKVFKALETADKNAGSALAAGTAFMKILDPNSVVRESELGMALNASGWFDRATNIANQMQSGKVMTKTQVDNLKAAASNLFEEAKAAQKEIDGAYIARAKSYGADPKNVIIDRGQNSSTPAKSGGVDMSAIEAEMRRRGLK